MLLLAGIGAFFFLLHVATARRFAVIMPEQVASPWRGRRGGRLISRRAGLVAGPALSLFISAYVLAEGVRTDAYAPLAAVQALIYLVVLALYIQNARAGKEEDRKGKDT